jgi:integrase
MAEFEWPAEGSRGRAENKKFYLSPGIQAWRGELALTSKLTADDYVRRVALFSRITGLSASEIIRRARERPTAFRDLLSRYATGMLGRGRKAVYVRKHFDAIRSWVSKNSVNFDDFPKVSGRRGETVENEESLTPDQLRQLLAVLDLRTKVIALLMSQSGLRPGVLGSIDGSSGLMLGDLADLDPSDEPTFAKIPARLVVRSARSKNAKGYTTFIGPEGVEAIALYLRQRRAGGEILSSTSPVIARNRVKDDGEGAFVATKSIVLPIHRALVSLRIVARPYTLRSYFSSQLFAAEARGAMVRDAREAMLGHDLGVSGKYNLSKRLNPTLLEDLRGLYGKAYPYLSTAATPATSMDDAFRAILTLVWGYDEADIPKLGPLTPERMLELAHRQKQANSEASIPIAPGTQRVVDATAVEAWIEKGWRFVSTLNGSKAVIESPRDSPEA